MTLKSYLKPTKIRLLPIIDYFPAVYLKNEKIMSAEIRISWLRSVFHIMW